MEKEECREKIDRMVSVIMSYRNEDIIQVIKDNIPIELHENIELIKKIIFSLSIEIIIPDFIDNIEDLDELLDRNI